MVHQALYIDSNHAQTALLRDLQRNFDSHGVSVRASENPDQALQTLDQEHPFDQEPSIAIIGAGIEKPVLLARRVRNSIPDIQFIFLVQSKQSQLIHNLKSPAGGLSNDWEIVDINRENFLSDLDDKLGLLLKKRRFRTTLTGINRRLKHRKAPEVSDLKRYSVSLRYLSHIVEHAHDGIIATTLDGVIVKWNLASENLFKIIAGEAIGRSIFNIIPGLWSEQIPQYYRALRASKESYREFELDLSGNGDAEYPSKQIFDLTLSLIRDDDQQEIGVAIFVRDVTERKIAEKVLDDIRKDLQRMSLEDGLTGIPNRRHFDDLYLREWQRMQRIAKPLSIALMDVDFFKAYNDNYGHLAGDECLKLVAQTIQKIARRASDMVARYGGEEFVLVFPDTPLEDARILVEQCRDAVKNLNIPHEFSEAGASITISAGVTCVVPQSSEVPEDLLSEADALLYEAKHNGRDQVRAKASA